MTVPVASFNGPLVPPSVREKTASAIDLIGEERPCKATADQYSLFRHYLDARHPNGGMADMSVYDYSTMIEDTEVDTQIIEYRKRGPDSGWTGRGVGDLIAVTLTDVLNDGLSMVYSFFSPDEPERSLGTFLILDHITRAKRQGLSYLYLGYWVEGSKTMAYKARFRPQERLMPSGWVRFP